MTTPKVLPSYIEGHWATGKGKDYIALNPVTGKPVCHLSSEGFSFESILNYARERGKSLREFTFHERANQITALAKYLNEIKKKYYPISSWTGATLGDSKIDIDGGISTLFLTASLARRGLPDNNLGYEPGYDELSRKGSFRGKHLLVSKPGVAIFINAFNFPCWGMLEKLASAYIAGMPVLVKPASVSAYVAEAMMQDIVASKILHPGSVQMVNGSLGNTFDFLCEQDVISFTGSASTAKKLKSHPQVLEKSVAFNAEADSLNFAYLSQKARDDDPEFNACIDEIVGELRTKSGQRCTCIRRIFIPQNMISDFKSKLSKKLSSIKIGLPEDATSMGSLVSLEQHQSVVDGVEELKKENQIVYQGKVKLKGAYFSPTLLLGEPGGKTVHDLEVFGPVATLIPYTDKEEATAGIIRGRGSLVGSVYSHDIEEIRYLVSEVGAWHGRVNLINRDGVEENPGHGTVMPQMIHGGPGRAGASEELGGVRGIKHFLQRVAVQGHPQLLGKVSGEWGIIKRDKVKESGDERHPFQKNFDELKVGEGITTHRRTLTEADMVNFGCLTWDHFYAHFDAEAAKRSIFKKPVMHGYLVLSAAAGLFVDPKEGPVLANIGLRDLNFVNPVFPGDSIYVELTCKEKTIKPIKNTEIPPHGEVKWQVMVFNQDDVEVANYVVVTLVRRKNKP